MGVKDVVWVLRNSAQWTLAQHLNRLCKMLLRNCPDEFVVQQIYFVMKDGETQSYPLNRLLSDDVRQEVTRFMKKNKKEINFFQIQFINFQYRENIKLSLSGLEPFEHYDLVGENIPGWMHELVNRRFQQQISVPQKLWSYFYNRRFFRNSLSR